MTFKTKKIVTGIERKVSKKTEKEYTMINFLNDGGTVFSSMADVNLVIPNDVRQLTECDVEFEVVVYNGNITGLRTLSINRTKVA
jgi:hypothetical protein